MCVACWQHAESQGGSKSPLPDEKRGRCNALTRTKGMLQSMPLLLDSLWRATADCVRPRVIMLSLLPLLVMAGLALALGYFYWDAAVASMQAFLETSGPLSIFWGWLQDWGMRDAASRVAPLFVVMLTTPVIVLVSLLVVALFMMPALVAWVAERRFAALERQKGASLLASLTWSLGSTLLAVLALVLSLPLWLVPPLVLVLPPLIWGWLTYRVMAFDALSEHASAAERKVLLQRHRMVLLLMGVVCGYLGAAPAVIWASGVIFAAAFFVLIPVGIWIYTMVFTFSALWFSHFCLAALERLRAENAASGTRQPALATAPAAAREQA